MKNMRWLGIKHWILHPLFFSAYPILFYYSHNIGQVSFESVIKPLTITLGSTIFGWCLLRIVLKDWHRAGGIVSILVLLFFSYGHVKANIQFSGSTYLLLSMWFVLLLLGIAVVIRSNKHFINGTKILNAASLVMLGLVFINISIFQLESKKSAIPYSPNKDSGDYSKDEAPHYYPDIYFIVLDAYAREDVLRDIYGFDNSNFIDFLEKEGFYVADKAVANYGQTGLSLASSLNLNYLEEIADKIGRKNQSRAPLNDLIQNSFATNFLRNKGYKIIAFASTRPETELKNADEFLNSGITVNDFHEGLRNVTPLPDIAKPEMTEDVFAKFRRHTNFMFDNLGEVASAYDGPKFVFAHFNLPHPPFVFGPDGEPVQLESRFNDHDGNWLISRGRLSVQQYREHYRDQVIFANKRMKGVITTLLDDSSEPPVLVIFSDHGPRSGLVWESVESTDVKESMTILNAYHLPENGNALLYPGISPVNTFRVIFNHLFGTGFELLPDESFFSTARYLYDFQNVTSRVSIEPSENN